MRGVQLAAVPAWKPTLLTAATRAKERILNDLEDEEMVVVGKRADDGRRGGEHEGQGQAGARQTASAPPFVKSPKPKICSRFASICPRLSLAG